MFIVSNSAQSHIIEFKDYTSLSDKTDYEKIEDFVKTVINNKKETDKDMRYNIYVSKYDLNSDGIDEIFISLNGSSFLCGMTGNCSIEIYQKNDNSFNLILNVGAVGVIKVLTTKSNGFYDLKLGGRGFKYPLWTYDGTRYKLNKLTDIY